MYLNREQLLGGTKLEVKLVNIPELGGEVRVRGTTAAEQDDYNQSIIGTVYKDDKITTEVNFKNQRARLVVKCVLNEDGTRMFEDKDADALGATHTAIVQRLFDVVQQLSGITHTAGKDIEKN